MHQRAMLLGCQMKLKTSDLLPSTLLIKSKTSSAFRPLISPLTSKLIYWKRNSRNSKSLSCSPRVQSTSI